MEPTEGQVQAFKDAYLDAENDPVHDPVWAGLRAALNFEEPYTEEDKKYDFALQATDSVNGDGTYAEINFHNPDPGVQRAIKRWRDKK